MQYWNSEFLNASHGRCFAAVQHFGINYVVQKMTQVSRKTTPGSPRRSCLTEALASGPVKGISTDLVSGAV